MRQSLGDVGNVFVSQLRRAFRAITAVQRHPIGLRGNVLPSFAKLPQGILAGSVIAFECPFDYVGGHVEAARLRNHLLEPTRVIAIPRIVQNRLNQWAEAFYRQIFYLQEFTHSVMCNTSSNAWLVISNGDCHHRNSLSKRLKSCI